MKTRISLLRGKSQSGGRKGAGAVLLFASLWTEGTTYDIKSRARPGAPLLARALAGSAGSAPGLCAPHGHPHGFLSPSLSSRAIPANSWKLCLLLHPTNRFLL